MDLKILFEQKSDANKELQKLSTICEEALSFEKHNTNSELLEDLSGFGISTNLPSAIEDFDNHGDSDDSLGILSLDLLDNANEVFYQNSSKDFLSFVKIDCEHDLLVEHGAPGLSTIHSSEFLCDLNAVHSAEEQNDLNVTFMFNNHTNESDKFKAVAIKTNEYHEECQAPVCTLQNILSHSKFEESPIHKAASSPKYNSTPKHDINTTFALDESFLKSELNLSPVSNLNKTFNKKDVLQDKVMLANMDKLDPVNILSSDTAVLSQETGKNILNTTCNVGKSLSHQGELNKTFNNVFTIQKEMYVTVTYPEEFESSFNLKDKEKDVTYENIHRNVSNISISLPEEFENKFEAFNLEESNVALENALNASPASKVFKNGSYEEGIITNVLDKTQILNTTYEKMPQSSKIIESSKFQKPLCKQVGVTSISKIAASSWKSTKPDNMNIRKSICVPTRNNTKTLNNEVFKKRKTFGSISLDIDDVIGQNLVLQTTKNETNSSHYYMSKHCIKGKSSRDSLKLASKSKSSSAEASRTDKDLSFPISKVSSRKNKVELSGEDQLKLKKLGETVILTEKTAIKKSMLPSKKSSKCEIPRLTSQVSDRKTVVPISKQVNVLQKKTISFVEFQGNKATLYGIPEKRVLSQRNSFGSRVPGASCTQILTRKNSASGSGSNNYQIGSLASKIPTTTSKKINNEEKAVAEKPKVCLKNSSRRNLR